MWYFKIIVNEPFWVEIFNEMKRVLEGGGGTGKGCCGRICRASGYGGTNRVNNNLDERCHRPLLPVSANFHSGLGDHEQVPAVQCTYALALRILYPEVQDRVQQGSDRMAARGSRQHITMADQVNLPYVEATLNEVCGALVIWPPVGRPASCARSCRLGWNDFAIFEIGNIAADQFKLIAEFCHAAKFSF